MICAIFNVSLKLRANACAQQTWATAVVSEELREFACRGINMLGCHFWVCVGSQLGFGPMSQCGFWCRVTAVGVGYSSVTLSALVLGHSCGPVGFVKVMFDTGREAKV